MNQRVQEEPAILGSLSIQAKCWNLAVITKYTQQARLWLSKQRAASHWLSPDLGDFSLHIKYGNNPTKICPTLSDRVDNQTSNLPQMYWGTMGNLYMMKSNPPLKVNHQQSMVRLGEAWYEMDLWMPILASIEISVGNNGLLQQPKRHTGSCRPGFCKMDGTMTNCWGENSPNFTSSIALVRSCTHTCLVS